ncbi:AbrB/MazE/SpoVT family DNA-binding domain-containing protein [Oceanobacillus damuensis]|uniref:AbrB/MazE/SpoVT family DNA-binding domain-containing protein n=1 Tax=Oceanobacillus damuensis TaxID=937928 RepID=UPI00082E1D7C|nr:AbrB/MazE/SpoVT family DNA-binding domain-containing protein [Oceanobacillus damuensis]
MFEAKLTSKGQITIPIEIRRMLELDTGDQVSFTINENGIFLDKLKRPLTIQERFAHYDISKTNKEVSESMKEIDMGNDVGEEEF